MIRFVNSPPSLFMAISKRFNKYFVYGFNMAGRRPLVFRYQIDAEDAARCVTNDTDKNERIICRELFSSIMRLKRNNYSYDGELDDTIRTLSDGRQEHRTRYKALPIPGPHFYWPAAVETSLTARREEQAVLVQPPRRQ